MPTYHRKTMCSECPFRQAAPSGWLGPWTVDDLEDVIASDSDLICHVSVKKGMKAERSEQNISAKGQHCVGMLRYMNGHCKLSRDPQKAASQRELRSIKDKPVIPPRGFREHHT